MLACVLPPAVPPDRWRRRAPPAAARQRQAGRLARRDGAGEEEGRALLLAQEVDDALLPGDDAAHDAERFGERPHFHIELAVQPKVVADDAAPAVPQHAFAVRVIDHREQPVFLRHLVNFVQRCDVAVHRKDAVGDDQPAPVLRQEFLDLRFQIGGDRSARRR